jgi:6,7-dimethyl-8-ribityllumazine synthase
LALVVVLVVVRWGVPEPRWAAVWLGLEPAAHALLVRPTVGLAHVLARFDDDVLDRAVEAAATASIRLAERVARIDVRRVDAAVEAAAVSVRRLGELARRSQTGLLHQYYLTAVVLLAAIVLLLVTVR